MTNKCLLGSSPTLQTKNSESAVGPGAATTLRGWDHRMKWSGYPVEIVMAEVAGHMVEIGVVYEWADGERRVRWNNGIAPEEHADLQFVSLIEGD